MFESYESIYEHVIELWWVHWRSESINEPSTVCLLLNTEYSRTCSLNTQNNKHAKNTGQLRKWSTRAMRNVCWNVSRQRQSRSESTRNAYYTIVCHRSVHLFSEITRTRECVSIFTQTRKPHTCKRDSSVNIWRPKLFGCACPDVRSALEQYWCLIVDDCTIIVSTHIDASVRHGYLGRSCDGLVHCDLCHNNCIKPASNYAVALHMQRNILNTFDALWET